MRLFDLKLQYAPAHFTAGSFFEIDITLLAPVSIIDYAWFVYFKRNFRAKINYIIIYI